MAVKIRLSRQGRKNLPFYHIVVADSRAPQGGRIIEKLGTYNPLTNPPSVELNNEAALQWVLRGAKPTPTVRSLLSKKGIMLQKHLLQGVKKGAFDLEEAQRQLDAWLQEKEKKNQAIMQAEEEKKKLSVKQRHEAEIKKNQEREAAIRKQREEELKAQREKEAAEQKAKEEAEAEESAPAEAEAKEQE